MIVPIYIELSFGKEMVGNGTKFHSLSSWFWMVFHLSPA